MTPQQTARGSVALGGDRSLRDVLLVEHVGSGVFSTPPRVGAPQRTYGGEVLGQALAAAGRTVPSDLFVRSLQANFLSPGDVTSASLYEVESLRDTRSYSWRSVTVRQQGQVIAHVSVSFTAAEDGFTHQLPSLDANPPEHLPRAQAEIADAGESDDSWLRQLCQHFPFELRFDGELPRVATLRGEIVAPRQRFWMKCRESLPSELLLHQCALAYASDILLLSSSLPPHGLVVGDAGLRYASLDHALWFHIPVWLDDWVCHEQEAPRAAGGRAFCSGRLFSRDGTLVASVVQEAMIRYKSPDD